MAFKRKIVFVILSLFVQLYFFAHTRAEPVPAGQNAFGQETLLPASVAEKDRLTLVSFLSLMIEGEILGAIAEYDDATTERPADYLELYNSIGDLLAFSWFDRFGIQRAAVDRGLLEEAVELEGVYVLLLLEGDSV